MPEPCELSLVDAAAQIREGVLRPSQLLDSCLERIAEREPTIQAWRFLDVEGARAQAAARDGEAPRSALHGVPVAVKDIIDVAGLPTGCGSTLRGLGPADADAWVTERLRAAGAVVLGKSVTTEFAYFTPGPTRNPRDPDRTPGGSSSGSAAAVADFLTPLALGTQTAASTTRPASYCGVAGLVTTPGAYPTAGIAGLSPTLDSLGLLARRVADLEVAADALLGITPAAPAMNTPNLLLCPDDAFGELEPDMRDALGRAASTLVARGARLAGLEMTPGLIDLVDCHATVMAVEASRSLATEAKTGLLSEPLQLLLERGNATSAQEYAAALSHADAQRDHLLALLDGHDAVLAAAAPGPAPLGWPTGDPVLSRPWQVLGLPTVAIPGLRSIDGLPLGIQVVGRPGAEGRLLAVATWVEAQLAASEYTKPQKSSAAPA